MKKITLLSTLISIALFIVMAAPASADSMIIPHRVIDMRTRTVVDFEGLLARCADARIVTLGEQHDDPATHQIELAVLEGLYRMHPDLVFSLEMFERDVQDVLDSYIAGEITEDEFLTRSRPWGNYSTDYRPLIEHSREHGLRVVASNVPRYIAGIVAENGYEAAEFAPEDIPWISSTFEAPHDGYFDAFSATMMMPGMRVMGVDEESIQRFYEAQVIKDETMAESVTRAAAENPEAIVYHIAGGFHLMDYLGTFSRIKRNIPGVDAVSIQVVPVDDLLAPVPEDAPKADFIILVLAPQEVETVMPLIEPTADETEAPTLP